MVGNLGVGFLDGVLNEILFEAELGSVVDDIDTGFIKGKRGHMRNLAPEQ